MAELYRRKDSLYWYAEWYDLAGKRHQRSTRRERKRDAQLIADQWERESLRDPVEVARESATMRQALDLLSAHLLASVRDGSMADETARHYVEKAKRVKEYFGDARALRTIDTAAVRDYCEARRAPRVVAKRDGSHQRYPGAGSHTLTKEINVLRLALRLAKERGLWSGDLDTLQPAELSARYRPKERALTYAEAEALRAVMVERSPHRWAQVAFVLGSGAERRAVERAHRRDVDLPRAFVALHGTKRATRERPVPIVLDACRAWLVEALALADGDRPRSVAPDELAAASTRPLFTTWGSASRDLAVACRAAGIARVSFNDLRRSWATWHVEAGVALDTLFRPMGHATPSTLARTYAKPSRETTADAMRAQIAARAMKTPKGDPET